ncbi:MAG: nucleotide-binding protein [Candidatus Altiarchaeota archaeon]|nr:nucleotide-binding protein [Candidatus Altiarchaeota archaeon]
MDETLVLLDTNFFLVPFQLGVNIFSELDRVLQTNYTLVTLSPQLDELTRLSKDAKKGSDKTAARIGLELARGMRVIESPLKGDEAILDFAKRNKCIVCTNDSELRKKLKGMRTRTIFVRNRQKLALE